MKLTIKRQDSITRLDKFLAEKLPDLSRSFIQKQIKAGSVTLNGKSTNINTKPKIGDIININKTKQDKPDISPNDDVEFKVIYENKEYIILEKPAGLIVHPALGINETTLANGLLAKYPELKKIGEDELRPGIVHRLDRDVSGLMVIARAEAMLNTLKRQFQERTIKKEYTALVHGIITEEDGIIDTPIGRSRSQNGKMAAHPRHQKNNVCRPIDRDAKTEFKVIKRIKNYTLLQIDIHTGRSHQIRVHMNSIQYPIVGDKLYTNKKVKQIDLGRIFLHASKLGFTDLNNEYKEYTSDLPKELRTFLKSL